MGPNTDTNVDLGWASEATSLLPEKPQLSLHFDERKQLLKEKLDMVIELLRVADALVLTLHYSSVHR